MIKKKSLATIGYWRTYKKRFLKGRHELFQPCAYERPSKRVLFAATALVLILPSVRKPLWTMVQSEWGK